MVKDNSQNAGRLPSLCFGFVFFAVASFMGLSLLLAIFSFTETHGVLSVPGAILFSVYGFSSLLIPCLFLYASILLLIPGWTVRSGILLSGSIFPFFTAFVGEKLVVAIAVPIGNETFSLLVTIGLLFSTFLVILIEYILLLHIGDMMHKKSPKPVVSSYVRDFEAVQDSELDTARDSDLRAARPAQAVSEPTNIPPVQPISPTINPAVSDVPIHEEPMYVDFERMKAPFDLPVMVDWVDPTDISQTTDSVSSSVQNGSAFGGNKVLSSGNNEGLLINDELNIDDSILPEDEFVIDDSFPEDELIIESDFDDDDDENTVNDDLSIDEEPMSDEESIIDDALTSADPDFPPVVSVPPVAHDATISAVAPFWKKKHRNVYTVPFDILTSYPDGEYWIVDDATRRAAAALKETLNEFSIQADVTGIRKGPVITMFEILPAPGVKLSKIVGLQDNIALRLAASSVRIVAPIPGKHAVGIEVPNLRRSIVSFRELIETDTPASKKMEIPVVLGKDITGEAQILDLALTPHLLIAGSTGSGKSVCVNAIILSILYKRSPEDVRLILIDPKIVELKLYNGIGHLLSPVITEPKKAFQALQYCLCEMERRYSLLDGMGVRDIKSYNRRIKERNIATEKLPYLVVIIDEFADLMATTGKELESTVARLCAMSRAVGIHLVLATQRPSIDVITGLIKANIPSRIAFMVASKMDSRIIIDQMGAEKLLGRGDMLYSSATDPFPVRIQGAFVSEEDVEKVVTHVKTLGEPEYIDEEIFVEDDDEGVDPSLFSGGEDPLYDKALEIVLLAGKASASYIQRRLKIGYNRAARLVEDMEARGIVGPANGSKPREVVHHP